VGETYISLNMLFRHESEEIPMIEVDDVRLFSYKCRVEDKGLWNHGHIGGTLNA